MYSAGLDASGLSEAGVTYAWGPETAGMLAPPVHDMALTAVQSLSALEPFATGRPYLNFVETADDVRRAYGEDRWLQLKGIRSAVDPYGVFAANHPVPRLYEGGRPTA